MANNDELTEATRVSGARRATTRARRPTTGSRRPTTGASRPTTASTGATASTVSTPREAIRAQEIRRLRALAIFTGLCCALVIGIVPYADGSELAKNALTTTSAIVVAASVVLLVILRIPERHRPWHTLVYLMLSGLELDSAYYLFGIYSGVLMVVPITIYLVAQSGNRRLAVFSQVHVQGAHLIISVLEIIGTLPEESIVVMADPNNVTQKVLLLVSSQSIMMAAFVVARGVLRNSVTTLEELDRAVSENARRNALLMEARQELAVARKIGGPGRYTEQVLGDYRLGELLGRGGMGEVYAATDEQSGDLVAVKLLSREATERPDNIIRFQREVEIARGLHHRNIVQVVGHSAADSPVLYLAMERLSGKTLSAVIHDRPQMPLAEFSVLMSEVSSGVSAAHAAGIIHRDLKPSNIFLQQSGKRSTWKILDFGVSKLEESGDTLTAGGIIGTPAYMSPEQAAGGAITKQTDIYSLGVVAYRVLTGRPAFVGIGVPQILNSVTHDMPRAPSENTDLPERYDYLFAIAMAKNPANRFTSAHELAAAFTAAAEGQLPAALLARGQRLMRQHPWFTATVALRARR